MSFLRNVVHDLVEKKLWPVAVALLAALVAVPIVLGGSSDAGTSAPGAAIATGPNGLAGHRDVARGQVVSLEAQAAGKVERKGAVRDPFVQHHQPKKPNLDAAAAKTAVQLAKTVANALTGGAPAGGGSTGGGTSTGGATLTPRPAAPNTPKADNKPESTYSVALKFGENGAEKTYDNVARLTPLPSSTNPFFVFLGLSADGKSAVFLVSSDAVASGDGTCQPSPDSCEQIVLKKGDIEFFEMQSGTAGVVQYQLTVKDIKQSKAATKASAARLHSRESRAGREYLRELMATDPTTLSGWDYSSRLGLLVEKDPVQSGDVANVPADVAAAAQGQAPVDTSTVLTVPAVPQG